MADHPLMPKATAVWLIDNTMLTFEQIAKFCGIHRLEIQALADGEIGSNIQGVDPMQNEELTQEEITRCEANDKAELIMLKSSLPQPDTRTKGPRYTPVAKRAEKPDAIAYLVKMHPELSDAQIGKLIGTTRNTIIAVRENTHINSHSIKPKDPVLSGLCKQIDLNEAIEKAIAKAKKSGKDTTAQDETQTLKGYVGKITAISPPVVEAVSDLAEEAAAFLAGQQKQEEEKTKDVAIDW